MKPNNNITGIILAGGKSSRMGTDKGFLELNGVSFMERIIQAMKPLVSNIIIVSDNPDYGVFGLKRIKDVIEDAGPLAGLYSGLKHSESNWNLVVSCDVPQINTTILKLLIDQIDKNNDVVQLSSQGKTMPLIAVYNKDCLHRCLELLKQDERRLRYAVSQFETKTIELDSKLEKYIRNINTTEDLKNLKYELEH